MRKVTSLLLFFVSSMSIIPNSTFSQEKVPPTPPTRVYYSVFIQSFYDSNGDGIGDINGLTSKLDYLKDLGIQGLWMLPVHKSPSYHKYDVADYYSIHPDYGTINDYKNLVKEAHKRNIVVLLDLVVNHTSSRISWFQEASRNPSSKYRDYYVWSSDTAEFNTEPFHWHAVRDSKGKLLPGPKYYGFFWWEMPDLNFDNQKVRQEVFNIASYWLKDIGVDGFRIDAAKYNYPENQLEKNLQWWSEFRKECLKVKKDVILIGEVWAPAKEIAPYLRDGMTACFNFQLADSIRISLQEEKDHYILQTWWQTRDQYVGQKPDFEDAIFLSNHDINRIMTDIGNQTPKAKVAASILLTLPGNPFLYYGEEIGMLGEKPDEYIREPFIWNIEGIDKGQTTWEMPYASNSNTVKPLAFQDQDPASLYHHYKALVGIRNTSLALSRGSFQPVIQDNRKILAFIRQFENESILVMINLSREIQRLENPRDIGSYSLLFGSHGVFKAGSANISLQPYSTFILKRN